MSNPFLLDNIGLALALMMGLIIFVSGGAYGLNMLLVIFIFLVVSVFATKYGANIKRALNIYEGERGWKNVLSNGLMPTILALLYYFHPAPFSPDAYLFAYVASIASITADKFASEIGVFDKPAFLWGMKKVKPGTSGAVSLLGTLASLSGAFIVSIIAAYLLPLTMEDAFYLGVIGFIGSFADSIFGIFEEWGIGNKYSTNFICSLVGTILALLIHL